MVFNSVFVPINFISSSAFASSSVNFIIVEIAVSARVEYFIGKTVDIWVMIKNTGSEKIEAYDLEASFILIYPDGQKLSLGIDWNRWDIKPGDIEFIDPDWVVPSTAKDGWYGCEVSILHKPTSLFKQMTKNNLFKVITSPPDIDLVGEFYVNGIKYEKSSKIYLTSISASVKYVIRNIGSQNAGAFNVRFGEVHSNYVEIKRYSGLAAGQSIEFEKIFSPLYVKKSCLPHMCI